MKTTTKLAREIRDELYACEASLDAQIAASERFVATLERARAEAGLTGTVGMAAIAGAKASLDALVGARAELKDSHDELMTLYTSFGIRGVAINPKQETEARAARVG